MSRKWVKGMVAIILALGGMAALVIAVFSYQLHIDNNPTLGPNRIALAIIGGLLLLTSATLFFSHTLAPILELPGIRWLINGIKIPLRWLFEPAQEEARPRRSTFFFAIGGALIAILITIWYINSGRMITWSPSTAYFDRQANAFLAGQLSLLEKPPAGLASLANPYQIQNRSGVGYYIWDASYYQGKYYYYWGPVPGLLAAAVKLIHPGWVVEDQYLILFSIILLAATLAGLFHRVQKNYFSKLPGWLVMLMTLVGTLNTPVFWLVNHPDVHEVPIALGQAFLILGIYTALRAIESQRRRPSWLILTGLFWGAALASRIDLLFGIGWMAGLVCLYLFLKSKNWQFSLAAILALLLPLALWGASLAWYNYARFGNILETGHRYQLTGGAMPADYKNIVSASYILPNLYNMLARPFEIHWREFPIFFTPYIYSNMWPKLFFFPRNLNYFYNEPIAGIFLSMPVIWILVLFFAVPLKKFAGSTKMQEQSGGVPEAFSPSNPAGRIDILPWLRKQTFPIWLMWMAAGSAVCNLAFLSIFIYSTMRYLADLSVLLTILIFIGVGWLADHFSSRARIWCLTLVLLAVTSVVTIVISLLTNFQNTDWRFLNNNPHLYQAIAHFITGK